MSGKRKVEQGGATPAAGGGEMRLVPAGFSTGAAISSRRRTSIWRSPTRGRPRFHHDTPVIGSVSLVMSLVSLRGCRGGRRCFQKSEMLQRSSPQPRRLKSTSFWAEGTEIERGPSPGPGWRRWRTAAQGKSEVQPCWGQRKDLHQFQWAQTQTHFMKKNYIYIYTHIQKTFKQLT